MEKSGESLHYPPYPFTVQEDMVAVAQKLDDLVQVIEDFSDNSKSSTFVKLQTKLNHVLGRLDNMACSKADEFKQRGLLVAQTLSMINKLNTKATQAEGKIEPIPPNLCVLQGSIQAAALPDPFAGAAAQMPIGTSTPNTSNTVGPSNIKPILPHKWGIKFAGDKKKMSVTAFFERVEELRRARNVTKEILLESGIDLFEGRAYEFYQDCRAEVQTWDELVNKFKEEYQPPFYSEHLLEEIKRRTQGPDESIGTYMAIMSRYFQRLHCPISEEAKLAILMRNISPFYRNQLGALEIDNIAQLKMLCKRIEYRMSPADPGPSSRRNCSLEPDLAYVKLEEQLSEMDISGASTEIGGTTDSVRQKEIICFNCNKAGHKAIGCAEKRKIYCYGYFILDHAVGDERPYLKVDILGYEMLGLLDSGASRTFVGRKGWEILKKLQLKLNTEFTTDCRVANGQRAKSIGTVEVPVKLRDRVKIVEMLVVPDIPHTLILGYDFWVVMGIIPDLKHNEWHFAENPNDLCSMELNNLHDSLNDEQRKRLEELVHEHRQTMGDGIGCTNMVEHKIETTSQPIRQRSYRVSPVLQKVIEDEVNVMLEQDVIEPSNSPWASPVVLVKKKNTDKYRFCVDFRILNSKTERDSYPLPLVSETLDKLRDAKYLSTVDVKSAYWQIPMEKSSKPLTAFICHKGLFQFKRMPFGLHNAAATWQRFIDTVLADLAPFVFVYLDDIVIVTQTFEEHLRVLEEVLRRLKSAGVTISWDKCQFCRPEMKYLGYVIDQQGLRVDPDKVRVMLELKPPTSVKEVRRIIGSFSWYRRFIQDFSTIMTPITALTKKNKKFEWNSECDIAFKKVKELLVRAPILSCPDYTKEFLIATDASGYGIGAVLYQPHDQGDKVICYLSRSLSKQERLYTTSEREMLAVVWAIQKLRPYIEGVPFTVVTDHHCLKWLLNLKDPTGRLGRWSIKLQMYDFKVQHRSGREMALPDMLSRTMPVLDEVKTGGGSEHKVEDKWYNRMVMKVERVPLKFLSWRIQDGRLYKYVKQDYPDLLVKEDF
ncbi:uncharacterized protein LOC123316026 [Coccinella septempunctata]|uniref:uncharacterized protein LOC123316026 n=1 Tax=Coccinella septempunctata TaxID=41139 RepID=UPI001D05E702|nr:uncharacterized protein LOC123316026 [Coccinella septempunctata]